MAVEVDQDDELVFFGNEIGNIRIMKLKTNIKESKMDILITDHLSSISHIHCNSDLNLWVSASIDGYINLYTLPLSKLLRSIKVDTSNQDIQALAERNAQNYTTLFNIPEVREYFVHVASALTLAHYSQYRKNNELPGLKVKFRFNR